MNPSPSPSKPSLTFQPSSSDGSERALSEPSEEDGWKVKDGLEGEGDGFTGFVHQTVIDNYLNYHENPEDIEVYFCGPPLMNQAIEKMADDFGVPPENVRFDDFGG